MTTRIPPQPSTTVGRPAKPLAVRRLAIAAALLAFLPALAGCMSGAPGPLASLPTAAESSRAFRAMGYSNVSCRQTSPKQMKCYSRQTGAVYSSGYVDRCCQRRHLQFPASPVGQGIPHTGSGWPTPHRMGSPGWRDGSRPPS